MKLNNRLPGLPKWPAILHDPEAGTHEVFAKHVSYRRFIATQVGITLLGFAIFSLPFVMPKNTENGWIAFVGGFALLFTLCIPYVPQAFCRLFYPRVTRIAFLPGRIVIGRTSYELRADAPVQFRAVRPAMSELKLKRLEVEALAKRESLHSAYKLRFRWVEMIYGMRVIPITTVADELRAEQFAVALQEALRLSMTPAAVRATEKPAPASARAATQDALPE